MSRAIESIDCLFDKTSNILLLPPDDDRLIYSGKQLSDEKTLQEYNVAAGGTIHMVLQLRGG